MSLRSVTLLASLGLLGPSAIAVAQTTPPVPPKPPAAAPARPPARPPAAAPARKVDPAPAVARAAPAAPTGLHFKSNYTTGDQVTESTTYIQAERERYELADMILLTQHDQKRTIQISRASNTYLVTPEGLPAAPAPVSAGAAPKAPGVVTLATTIVDTGERKDTFGQQARHVKSVVDRQPQPGACDTSKLRIETDAWYIDTPRAMATSPATGQPPPAGLGCADEVKTTENGDPKLLGFPVSYSTTFIDADDKDGKPVKVTMDVTEFEVVRLDAMLFEIPPGMTAAINARELAVAISDANEIRLASAASLPSMTRDRKPGVMRVGVPEVANKGAQTVDTRALRTRLIAELESQKIEATPMAAASPEELQARAAALGVDYLLVTEIAELKVSKPGGLTRMMKVTSGEGAKDVTEAKISVQLVPLGGGKPRLATTTSGKDGGVGLKTGLGIARFAGGMYFKMMTGGMLGSQFGAFNTMSLMNMGGMGMLGNPTLMAMQSGTGALRMGMGADRTAVAASYLMQQAISGAASAGPQGGPSFDAAFDEAIQDAGKKVVEVLKKPVPTK